MNTPIRALSCLLASCALIISAKANTGARVYCWAPHLSSPILLNSYGMGVGSYAGRPYGYKILGVAGILTLGDQVDNAFPDPNDPSRRFRQGSFIGRLGENVNVSSSVRLQVNYAQFYPQQIVVTGDRPGSTTGAVRRLGEVWETTTRFGHPEVTLVFHLAGNGLFHFTNRNPNGYFYVIAEYQPTAPEVTGQLSIPQSVVLRDTTAPVGYEINRTGTSTLPTPPFSGYDQSGEITFISN